MPNETMQFMQQFQKDMGTLQKQAPEVVEGFMSFFNNVMKDGQLSQKEKELIALGIGVASKCKHCIIMHIQKSLAAGATREQIMEAAAVSVMMAGGPAYTHLPIVMKTLDDLDA
jgi:AhpD family alkylhydroperoxidase